MLQCPTDSAPLLVTSPVYTLHIHTAQSWRGILYSHQKVRLMWVWLVVVVCCSELNTLIYTRGNQETIFDTTSVGTRECHMTAT